MVRIVVAVVAAVLVVGAVWLAWGVYSVDVARWAMGNIFIPAQAGPWGDSFGPFSAFFSALGFAAVLVTLWVQQGQIKQVQRDQHRQRFDDNFFQLLAVIRENRKDVRFGNSSSYKLSNPRASSKIKEGHSAFRAAYREIRHWILEEKQVGRQIESNSLGRLYSSKVHVRYESTLGAYFRLVYEALDRVERDPYLSEHEKDEFGNLVRGQMTSFEAVIAGCNALNHFAKDFNRLIIRFRLLKYARQGEVYELLKEIYPAEAFHGRDSGQAPVPDVSDDEELEKEFDD